MTKSVAVAMSGGVDSLYAALTLKNDGYAVTGVHFVTGYEQPFDFEIPRSQGDVINHIPPVNQTETDKNIADAMGYLAGQLDIPIHIIDCKSFFKTNVIDYFIQSYHQGLTPNPCLICNDLVKFGFLKSFAQQTLGINLFATGHYACTRCGADSKIHLKKHPDHRKDQSYFLAFLTQAHLSNVIFPLSGMTKQEIKDTVRSAGLNPLSSSESQDICFITTDSYQAFIANQPGFRASPGDIILQDERVIGKHQGLHGFTIGQRKGINCPGPYPYYVTGIDTTTNRLIVGPKDALRQKKCHVTGIRWHLDPPSESDLILTKIRYAHAGGESLLKFNDDHTVTVFFQEPQYAVTPGQGAVFYFNDEVLGGGIISAKSKELQQ